MASDNLELDYYASEEFESERSEREDNQKTTQSEDDKFNGTRSESDLEKRVEDENMKEDDVTREGNNGDKVLVEKDGKFELVNASEVSAHWELDNKLLEDPKLPKYSLDDTTNDAKTETEKEGVEDASEASKSTELTGLVKTQETNAISTESHPSDEHNRRLFNESNEEDATTTVTSVDTREQPFSSVDSSRVSEEAISMITLSDSQETEARTPLASERAFHSSHRATFSRLSETKPNSGKSARRDRHQQELDESAKRQEAQNAFRAWLSAKKQQKQKERAQSARLEKEREQSMAWTVGSAASRENCDARFQEWLEEKKQQRYREHQLQTRQQQLMEKSVIKPSEEEIEAAYKQWLKGKQKQQRAARQQTEVLRKQQKVEARRIKQSLDMRFSMA